MAGPYLAVCGCAYTTNTADTFCVRSMLAKSMRLELDRGWAANATDTDQDGSERDR